MTSLTFVTGWFSGCTISGRMRKRRRGDEVKRRIWWANISPLSSTLFLLFSNPCLLKNWVKPAFAMVGCGRVTTSVVVIEDEMLALVADDV